MAMSPYDAAVSRYEAPKAEREKVAADIRQRGIRRREFERFIVELEKLPRRFRNLTTRSGAAWWNM